MREGDNVQNDFGAGVIVLYRQDVGNTWARNQHIAHLFPRIYQCLPHPHNISPFSLIFLPQIVNKSASSLHLPHLRINVSS